MASVVPTGSNPRAGPVGRKGGPVVVQEAKLSTVLSEFATTLTTDFAIQDILDHLVTRIVEVLPVTAAGVTLITGDDAPQYIAASDEAALRFERLQTELGQGPCVAAFRTGRAVALPDLRSGADGFAQFAGTAAASGLAAVFAFPIRHGEGRLGALDLYRDTAGPLDVHDLEVAQTLADVAAAYLINAQGRDRDRAAMAELEHLALHDALTGLPNRVLLHERLSHAAHRAERSRTTAAVLFVDLDRFKDVNDRHGHGVGDELLRAVAHRLASLVRPSDTLARVSGDEFVFLCEDIGSAENVDILALRITGSFREPFVLAAATVSLTASVGVAFAGPGTQISDELVGAADAAMYAAKRLGGKSHQILDLRETVQPRGAVTTMERDLRTAVAHGDLDVAYQPIVRSGDGVMTGVEALVRWSHAERGRVPATSIVGAAERTGLIGEIGMWVLERSARDRSAWLARHPDASIELSVNVSARQLMTAGYVDEVTRVLAATGLDPGALVLEVTETLFLEDSQRAVAVLADLRLLGVRLALDDFGTGYSSLSYLQRFPIDIVKIDRCFIGGVEVSGKGRAIVEAVTTMAHVLGLAVTAEGVETRSERDAVNAVGCDQAQGYFYARPMTAAAIGAHLDAMTAGEGVHLPV